MADTNCQPLWKRTFYRLVRNLAWKITASKGRPACSLTSVKIKITFITASPDRAMPLKGDAAHISVNPVIAQAERLCQLFAAK